MRLVDFCKYLFKKYEFKQERKGEEGMTPGPKFSAYHHDHEVISKWKVNIEKNLSIEYGFPRRTCLMRILHIHVMIFLPESML